MIKASRCPEMVKLHDPDTFNREDPKKLKTQCQLNFFNCPQAFDSNSQKVNYVLSYLWGSALEWFKPMILDGDAHPVLSNYKLFSKQLMEIFSLYDAI